MRLIVLATAGLFALAGCKNDDTTPAATAPATPAATPAPASAPAASPQQRVFAREELDQMVAPIALYPDSLLAQVLMAATYPGEVADAVAWSKAHPDAQGDAAVRQVAGQPWDASVQSLVAFPQALAALGQDPAWVQRLGDAFLAQPNDVMDAVQRLRRQAQAAGNLDSNQYQKVSVQPIDVPVPAPVVAGGDIVVEAPPAQVIVIEPAQPDVVYVPSYNPTTVYGAWAYPAYPPVYYPPPAAYYPVGTAFASGLAWGMGLAVTDAIWGGIGWNDWGHGDVDIDIDVDRYNSINTSRQIDRSRNTWNHDPAHRNGVPYRDQANRDRYGHQVDGAANRAQFRGDDPARAQAREQARSSMERRGVDAPARTNAEARERAQQAARDPARERAGQATRDASRERAQAGDRSAQRAAGPQGERDAARQRAQATAQRDLGTGQTRAGGEGGQQRARADTAQRDPARASTQQRQQASQYRQSHGNEQARNAARQQHSGQSRSGNNAFHGASQPSASRAAAQRGHASQSASRQHGSSSRPSGGQVSRPASHANRGGRR